MNKYHNRNRIFSPIMTIHDILTLHILYSFLPLFLLSSSLSSLILSFFSHPLFLLLSLFLSFFFFSPSLFPPSFFPPSLFSPLSSLSSLSSLSPSLPLRFLCLLS